MIKKIITISLFCIICLTGCNSNKQIYLSDKYYNDGEYIEITNNDLENKKDETYILFTYNNYCSFSVPCDEIFKEVMKKYKIDVLSIPFEEFKNSNFHKQVKFAPSVIIVDKGKIVAYLDPESNNDLDKYQDSNKFEEWLDKYIYFNKKQ